MPARVNPRVLYTFLSFLVIVVGTLAAIQYAKGVYRITRHGVINDSGLLSANSFPNGAEVIIDGELRGATDDTFYLPPGTYAVEIVKDGYSSWKKILSVQKELVTQTNAALFPTTPSLTPLTFTGLKNLSLSPDGQKILYYTASASAETKNGLYVIELSNSTISFQRGPRQIVETSAAFDLSKAQFIWAPDSSEVLMVVKPPTGNATRHFLLDVGRKNVLAELPDVTFQVPLILSQWEEDMYVRERQYMVKFPEEMIAIATESAKNVYLSPDKNKLLYTATRAVTIPEGITPPILAKNTQPQERALTPGSIYVYDREEDTNFKVGSERPVGLTPDKFLLALDLFNRQPLTLDSSPSAFKRLQATSSAQTVSQFSSYHTSVFSGTFQWLPDSNHLVYTTENQIMIKEYDGTNQTPVYFGPYSNNFVYPWPDGSKLLILTSFGSDFLDNLYSIDLN